MNISLLDALQHVREYNKNVDLKWKNKWNEVVKSGILENTHRNSIVDYMKKHTDCDIKDIINHFKYEKRNYKEHPKLKEYCSALNIDYTKVLIYVNRNSYSVEEAIIHYRPDCYINCLGELVIPT